MANISKSISESLRRLSTIPDMEKCPPPPQPPKEKTKFKPIFDITLENMQAMKLNEVIVIDYYDTDIQTIIKRVPNGWLYDNSFVYESNKLDI